MWFPSLSLLEPLLLTIWSVDRSIPRITQYALAHCYALQHFLLHTIIGQAVISLF